MEKRKRPPPYPPHICLRLKSLRKKNGLSQTEVAEYLGITQQSYSAYEKGISYMHIEQFLALARLYDVSMDYITGASNLLSRYPKY